MCRESPFLPDTLNTIAVILITLILSYFTLVFGELVPKRIAMQKPDKVARASAGVITALSIVMKPIIWLLSASTKRSSASSAHEPE